MRIAFLVSAAAIVALLIIATKPKRTELTMIEPPAAQSMIVESSSPPPDVWEFSNRRAAFAVPEIQDEAQGLLQAIAQALSSADDESRENVMTNLLPALVHVEPALAGQFAATNTVTRDIMLQTAVQLLAAQNFTNALAWAGGLENTDERQSALTDVCRQLAKTDPSEAVAIRFELLGKDESYEALQDLTQTWADKDLAGALEWVSTRPLDGRRDLLLERVAFAYAQVSPADAARLIVEKMNPGGAQEEAAISVLHQWARLDMAAASQWAEQFPAGPLRDRAMRELVSINGYP